MTLTSCLHFFERNNICTGASGSGCSSRMVSLKLYTNYFLSFLNL